MHAGSLFSSPQQLLAHSHVQDAQDAGGPQAPYHPQPAWQAHPPQYPQQHNPQAPYRQAPYLDQPHAYYPSEQHQEQPYPRQHPHPDHQQPPLPPNQHPPLPPPSPGPDPFAAWSPTQLGYGGGGSGNYLASLQALLLSDEGEDPGGAQLGAHLFRGGSWGSGNLVSAAAAAAAAAVAAAGQGAGVPAGPGQGPQYHPGGPPHPRGMPHGYSGAGPVRHGPYGPPQHGPSEAAIPPDLWLGLEEGAGGPGGWQASAHHHHPYPHQAHASLDAEVAAAAAAAAAAVAEAAGDGGLHLERSLSLQIDFDDLHQVFGITPGPGMSICSGGMAAGYAGPSYGSGQGGAGLQRGASIAAAAAAAAAAVAAGAAGGRPLVSKPPLRLASGAPGAKAQGAQGQGGPSARKPKPQRKAGAAGGASPTPTLSPYNLFVRQEMKRLRAEMPDTDHRTLLKMAATNVSWVVSTPRIPSTWLSGCMQAETRSNLFDSSGVDAQSLRPISHDCAI